MNKFFQLLLTIALLTLFISSAHAQSAEKIIDRHIKAVGGKKTLKAITSANFIGAVNGPEAGKTGLFNWQMKTPNRTYMEIMWKDFRWSEAFNGKSAWRLDTMGGLRTLTGQEGARVKAAAIYRNDCFLTYKQEKTRVQLVGRENVRERPADVIELTTRAGIKRKIFFDAEIHLILKEAQESEAGTEEMFFSEYRPIDGVLEPFRIELHRGGETLKIALNQVTHNARLDDHAFDFPQTSDDPLPDIASLLQDVKNNQKKIDGIKVIREYEERQKKKAEREAQQERERQKAIAQGKTPKPKEEEEAGIFAFLRVCQFTNPRRERFRGQEVIVFDFAPKPDYKAQNPEPH